MSNNSTYIARNIAGGKLGTAESIADLLAEHGYSPESVDVFALDHGQERDLTDDEAEELENLREAYFSGDLEVVS